MLDIARCDKRKVLEEDRRRVRERLLQGVNKDGAIENGMNSTISSSSEPWIVQDKWESDHLGDFRQAYPGTDYDKYSPFFQQTQSSLYCQTAASRARDTAARIQRQEMEVIFFLNLVRSSVLFEFSCRQRQKLKQRNG